MFYWAWSGCLPPTISLWVIQFLQSIVNTSILSWTTRQLTYDRPIWAFLPYHILHTIAWTVSKKLNIVRHTLLLLAAGTKTISERLFSGDDSLLCSNILLQVVWIQDVPSPWHWSQDCCIVCTVRLQIFMQISCLNIKMMAGQSNNNFGDLF